MADAKHGNGNWFIAAVVGLALSILGNAVMGGALLQAARQEADIRDNTRRLTLVENVQAAIVVQVGALVAGQARIENLLLQRTQRGSP